MSKTTTTRTPLDADMLDMLRASLSHVLTSPDDRPLADRLTDLGWADVVEQDEAIALGLLFEIKGDTLSSADALGTALSSHLATVTGDPSDAAVTIGLPSPFGISTLDGGRLAVEAVAGSPPGDELAVPVGGRLAIVPAGTLTAEPLGGTDTALGLVRVHGTVADPRWLGDDAWPALVTRGRWLLSCELTGIGRHVVASAAEYTKERVQYGKPIGVFQALQHRLAGAHAMVVGASHLASQAGSDGDEWTALVAKCMAGQAAENACTQAQQCYGAIGFTWEHEFHNYLRRTYVLDGMLGDWRALEHEIGTRLQSAGAVPRISSL